MIKRNISAFLMALILLLTLAACNGEATPTESVAAEEPQASESIQPEEPSEETSDTPQTQQQKIDGDDQSNYVVESEQTGALTDVLAKVAPVTLPLTEEPVSFEVWMAAMGAAAQIEDLSTQNEGFAMLQERTGVKLEFNLVNFFAQSEVFSLMIASETYPAIMSGATMLYSNGEDAAIEDEVFINLKGYIEDFAPNYYALITANESIWNDVSTPEDNLAAFYSLYDDPIYGLGDKGYLIRQDWLDDLSLSIPKTYNELYDVLVAFRDKKGASDALALPVSGLADAFMGGYGVGFNFIVVNDEIKFSALEQGFKDYLQMLNQWYEEGLIFKDFYSFTNEIMFDDTARIGRGEVALFYNETGIMLNYAEYSDDPDCMFKAMASLVKNEGDVAYMTEFKPTYADNARWSITTNCDNPELAVQLCDYMYSPEGILLCNYGVEGISFEYSEDDTPIFTDLIMNNPDGYSFRDAVGLHTIDCVGTVYNPLRGATNYSAEQLSSWDDWTDANLDYSHKLPTKAELNMEEKSEYFNIYADIETFMNENIVRYITGDASFDTYETDFVKQIKGMNIQTCIDLYQIAYNRYLDNK